MIESFHFELIHVTENEWLPMYACASPNSPGRSSRLLSPRDVALRSELESRNWLRLGPRFHAKNSAQQLSIVKRGPVPKNIG
jgi:hypothetical protein